MLGEPLDLDAVRAHVPDGARVGVGGSGLQRKPMALLRALVAGGARDLEVVSFLGSLDVELLLAAGAIRRLHTAGVSLEAAGLAPLYRAARQSGSPEVVEWSEGSLHAALEATARALPSMPCGTSAAADVVRRNPHLRVAPDPFDGRDVVHAQALPIDVALLHVPAVNGRGDLFIDGDPALDGLLARAADEVIAAFDEQRDEPPAVAAVSRIWVDAVVHAPGGAWPTGCHATSAGDPAVVRRWARAEAPDIRLLDSMHQ